MNRLKIDKTELAKKFTELYVKTYGKNGLKKLLIDFPNFYNNKSEVTKTTKIQKEIKSTKSQNIAKKDICKKSINIEKIKSLQKSSPEKFQSLNKTEIMLMAFINNKDLLKVEKEIFADSSLKYKIKNHTEKYELIFLKKLQEIA